MPGGVTDAPTQPPTFLPSYKYSAEFLFGVGGREKMGGNIGRGAVVPPIRWLWWSLFLGMAMAVCHARNHVSFSGKEEIMLMGWAERSLKAVGLDDYNDPSPKQGAPTPGSGSGRKSHSSPDAP